MKLDPKKELQVLLAIEDLGEATPKEINEQLKKEINSEELNRYLRRLKAKKVITATTANGETAFKLADIPWQPTSNMARVRAKLTTMSPEEANQILEGWLKEAADSPKLPTTNKYRDYHRLEMTFETIDPILGDRPDGSNDSSQFPKDADGKAFIPPSWWKGWFRSNLYLLNIPEAVPKFRLGYVSLDVILPKEAKLESLNAMADKGPKSYQALPPGTQLKMAVKFPMVGTPLKTAEEFKNFIEEVAEEPQRGFGANPFYYGGRLKLLEFADKGLVVRGVVGQ